MSMQTTNSLPWCLWRAGISTATRQLTMRLCKRSSFSAFLRMAASTASDFAIFRSVICSGICISMVLRSWDGIFGRLASVRIDPARDADLVLGFLERFARFVIAVVPRLHVGGRCFQAGKGAVMGLAVGAVPIEAVR